MSSYWTRIVGGQSPIDSTTTSSGQQNFRAVVLKLLSNMTHTESDIYKSH